MIFLSLLAKTYGLAWGLPHWPAAVACWAASWVMDALYFRRRNSPLRLLIRDVVSLNVGVLIAGCAVQEAFAAAAMNWKDGIPGIASLTAFLLRALGLSAGAFRGELHLTTMAGPLSFSVSLDQLGLWFPACLAAGYAVFLLLTAATLQAAGRSLAWIIGLLVLASLARFVFSTALFLALCDFVSYETEELPWGPFVRPPTLMWTFLPFLLASWPLLSRGLPPAEPGPTVLPKPNGLRPGMLGCGLAVLFLIALWEPQGQPKSGKVLINTFHTQWSRTDRPYDREWYGADSGYNYACLKRWYEVFYDVRELKTRLQAPDLEGISVLVIYLPDRPFSEEERRLIVEFVRGGGGLFLIGDHTNVFGTSTHLNEICRPFGFFFRDDVLFDLDEDFFQLYDVPRLTASFLQGTTFFKFRGPTSIQLTALTARPVITLDHAKSLRAIYSVNNFYPPPHDQPGMKTGRFCVSAASRFGQGRVVAFADSTVFSNFEIFYPGKYEYLLNVAHWLNQRDGLLAAFARRCSLVMAVLALVWYLGRRPQPRHWGQTLTILLLAFYAARLVALFAEQERSGFPAPRRPAPAVFFAAEAKDPAYVLRDFTSTSPYDQRYDVLIQWVLRTGAFSGFYVVGSDHRPGLYEHLRQTQAVKTALALIVRGADQLELLPQLMHGPGAKDQRLLLLFSGKLDWPTIAAALGRAGRQSFGGFGKGQGVLAVRRGRG